MPMWLVESSVTAIVAMLLRVNVGASLVLNTLKVNRFGVRSRFEVAALSCTWKVNDA